MRFVMIDDDGKTEHVSVEDVAITLLYCARASFPISKVEEEISARIKKLAAKRAEAETAATDDHPQL